LCFVARILCAGHEDRLLLVRATIAMDIGAAGRQWRRNLGQEFALVVCGRWCLRLRVEGRGEHFLSVTISIRKFVRCVVENIGFRWEMESLMVFLRLSKVDAKKRVQLQVRGEGGVDFGWQKVAQAICMDIYVRTYICIPLSLHTSVAGMHTQ
jgi:hypothetical protein